MSESGPTAPRATRGQTYRTSRTLARFHTDSSNRRNSNLQCNAHHGRCSRIFTLRPVCRSQISAVISTDACSDLAHLSYAGKSTRSHSRTLPHSHSSTHPLSHSPTVPLSHSSHSHTLALMHSRTLTLAYSPTNTLSHSPIIPLSRANLQSVRHTHTPCFPYGFQQPPKQQMTMYKTSLPSVQV